MKQSIYFFLAVFLIAFASCDKENEQPQGAGDTQSYEIDATSRTTWHYFSFKNKKVVGTGEETKADNDKWFARTDWDIAVCRYKVRTNSGTSTTAGAKGGLYTCPADVSYASVDKLPNSPLFVADKMVTSKGHGGTVTISHSTAKVTQFKTKEDGSMLMPPVYYASPVYIFKTADGKENYKVNFTQYINEKGVTGHVKFDYATLH